jgi:hypothetical protein
LHPKAKLHQDTVSTRKINYQKPTQHHDSTRRHQKRHLEAIHRTREPSRSKPNDLSRFLLCYCSGLHLPISISRTDSTRSRPLSTHIHQIGSTHVEEKATGIDNEAGGASNERYQQRRTDSVGSAAPPPLLNRGSRLTNEKLERGPSALIRHVWV